MQRHALSCLLMSSYVTMAGLNACVCALQCHGGNQMRACPASAAATLCCMRSTGARRRAWCPPWRPSTWFWAAASSWWSSVRLPVIFAPISIVFPGFSLGLKCRIY